MLSTWRVSSSFCVTTETEAGISITGVSVLVPVAVSAATIVGSGPTTRPDFPLTVIFSSTVTSPLAAASCAKLLCAIARDIVTNALLAINFLANMRNRTCRPIVISCPLSDQILQRGSRAVSQGSGQLVKQDNYSQLFVR